MISVNTCSWLILPVVNPNNLQMEIGTTKTLHGLPMGHVSLSLRAGATTAGGFLVQISTHCPYRPTRQASCNASLMERVPAIHHHGLPTPKQFRLQLNP